MKIEIQLKNFFW